MEFGDLEICGLGFGIRDVRFCIFWIWKFGVLDFPFRSLGRRIWDRGFRMLEWIVKFGNSGVRILDSAFWLWACRILE